MIPEKDIPMAKAMETYGGSFVKALAMCLLMADHINYAKLELAFPQYFAEYRKMAEQKESQNQQSNDQS